MVKSHSAYSAATATHYPTPFGTFTLKRFPPGSAQTLQAWCAADTLLLEAVHRSAIPTHEILVVNDVHGSLCVALQPQALWTDSRLAALGLKRNQEANSQSPTPVCWSTEVPPAAPFVILRIPKQSAYFAWQLSRLANVLPTGATVFAAGMDKHLSPNTALLLERHIGPTERESGRMKARLFVSVRDPGTAAPPPPNTSYQCDPLGANISGLPNVFSRERLDPGSRLLLETITSLPGGERVIDLACGNGVLGLVAYKLGLGNKVSFVDESALAIASAQLNAQVLFDRADADFTFHQGDGLADYKGEPAQLILCNPPFHLEHTVDEFLGQRLLDGCAQHLVPGGKLCLVANRHLDYRPVLRSNFKRIERLAGNSRFNVLLACLG